MNGWNCIFLCREIHSHLFSCILGIGTMDQRLNGFLLARMHLILWLTEASGKKREKINGTAFLFFLLLLLGSCWERETASWVRCSYSARLHIDRLRIRFFLSFVYNDPVSFLTFFVCVFVCWIGKWKWGGCLKRKNRRTQQGWEWKSIELYNTHEKI